MRWCGEMSRPPLSPPSPPLSLDTCCHGFQLATWHSLTPQPPGGWRPPALRKRSSHGGMCVCVLVDRVPSHSAEWPQGRPKVRCRSQGGSCLLRQSQRTRYRGVGPVFRLPLLPCSLPCFLPSFPLNAGLWGVISWLMQRLRPRRRLPCAVDRGLPWAR